MAKKTATNSAEKIAIQLQKLSNQATEKSFKYNSAEALKSRQWQEQMSNTAHQREVADLKKAGLNPVLSANQGATAYSTTSASAQAENSANAVGNVWSSQISADATRAAAAQSAAAMKAAAAQQAAAARYAASLQYQASVYHSDKAYQANKDKVEAEKWIAMNKPQSSIVGVGDKYLSAASKMQIKDSAKLANKLSVNDFANKSGNISKDNFILNRTGEKKANQALLRLGLSQTKENRNLWTKAFKFGDKFSMMKLNKQIFVNKRASKRVSSARSLYW